MQSIVEVFNGGQQKWEWNSIDKPIVERNIVLRRIAEGGNFYSVEITPETFIADFKNKYKLIETLAKDKETRDDFCKKYELEPSHSGINCRGFKFRSEWIPLTVIELVGYWQEYILQRIKKESKL